MIRLNIDLDETRVDDWREGCRMYHFLHLTRHGIPFEEAAAMANWKDGLWLLLKSIRVSVDVNITSRMGDEDVGERV
jgi:hypothetical protein